MNETESSFRTLRYSVVALKAIGGCVLIASQVMNQGSTS